MNRWWKVSLLTIGANADQGKNKDRSMVGHIMELLGRLLGQPLVSHFEFIRQLGSSSAAMFHVVAFSLTNS